VSLRIWQPIIIHGLLQTAEYARALFLGAQSDLSDDALEQMVAARTGRQVILDRPEPPNLLVVLDEAVLHRLVGSPKIMHEQLIHLAAVSSRSHVSVQVIPAAVGAHAAWAAHSPSRRWTASRTPCTWIPWKGSRWRRALWRRALWCGRPG